MRQLYGDKKAISYISSNYIIFTISYIIILNISLAGADYCEKNSICSLCDYEKTECVSCANGYSNQVKNGACISASCDADQEEKTANYRGYQQTFCEYKFDRYCKKTVENVKPNVCQECMIGYYLKCKQTF